MEKAGNQGSLVLFLALGGSIAEIVKAGVWGSALLESIAHLAGKCGPVDTAKGSESELQSSFLGSGR